jgi:hypothetical protein
LEDQLNIHIPASIEDATARLTGLESLLTATEWEKAAIVAAFVTLSEGRGKANVKSDISCAEFASLGIAGLKSHNTVRRYVEAWTIEAGLTPPLKGQDVDLPDMPFPSAPADRSGGQTGGVTIDRIAANPAKVAEAIKADPALRKVAEEAVAEAVHAEMTAKHGPIRGANPKPEGEADLIGLLSFSVAVKDIAEFVKALTKVDTDGFEFTENVKTIVNEQADKAIALLNTAKDIVNGEVRTHLTDDDFDALLMGGSN